MRSATNHHLRNFGSAKAAAAEVVAVVVEAVAHRRGHLARRARRARQARQVHPALRDRKCEVLLPLSLS